MCDAMELTGGPVSSALQNSLILEYIFQYSSPKDLQNCRLVSKSWLKSSQKSWKSSSVIQLQRNLGITEFVAFSVHSYSCPDRKRFTNFSLHSIDFSKDATSIEVFWGLLGPQMKILKLTDCSFPCVAAIRKVIFESCPNLEHLYLNGIEINNEDERIYIQPDEGEWQEPKDGENCNLKRLSIDPYFKWNTGITWTEFFSHFPSLEVLELIGDIPCYAEYDDLFFAINTIRRHDPDKLKLTQIFSMREHEKNASPPIPETLYQLLVDNRLQLKKLSISLNPDDNAARLSQILAQHGKSLQMLELSARRFKSVLNPNECFLSSPLENLVELKLHFQVFSSLSVLQFTPNLRKLAIFESPTSITGASKKQDLENIKLDKCVALEVRNFLSVDELRQLVMILPNVERLRMPLDNETFLIVCENWTKLLSLEVIDCDIDDSGITGFDAETVEDINLELGKFFTWTFVRRRPNKTNLKYLQRLHFYSVEKPDRHPPMLYVPCFSLGFCAAKYGVAKIPNLQYLAIENYDGLALARFWNDLMLEFKWPFDSIDEQFNRKDLLDYP